MIVVDIGCNLSKHFRKLLGFHCYEDDLQLVKEGHIRACHLHAKFTLHVIEPILIYVGNDHILLAERLLLQETSEQRICHVTAANESTSFGQPYVRSILIESTNNQKLTANVFILSELSLHKVFEVLNSVTTVKLIWVTYLVFPWLDWSQKIVR